MTQQEFRKRFTYDTQKDLIAKGGFAEVFRAVDNQYKEKYHYDGLPLPPRRVALKFFTLQGEKKYTLEEEVHTAMQLQHPNIGRYLEWIPLERMDAHGELSVTEVAVMEYLDGGHIDQFVKANPTMLDSLLIDVLHALDYLHQHKIIHRDIKPSNVLGCYMKRDRERHSVNIVVPCDYINLEDGKSNTEKKNWLLKRAAAPAMVGDEYIVPSVKITDFGISKSLDKNTGSSTRLFGSKAYMAPEQIAEDVFGINGKIDTRVDIWSFGVMAYELIVGKKLFEGIEEQSEEQMRRRIMKDENFPAKLQPLSPRYRELLEKCLVRQAHDRCGNCEELISIIKGEKKTGGSGGNGDGGGDNGGGSGTDMFQAHYQQAITYYGLNLYNSANVEIKAALALQPQHAEAVALQKKIQSKLDGNTEPIDPDPEAFLKHMRVAKALYDKGDFKNAETEIILALALQPKDSDAIALQRQIQQKLAEEQKTQFLKQYRLAQTFFNLKDYQQAKIATEMALRLQPASPNARALLVQIQQAQESGAGGKKNKYMTAVIVISVVVLLAIIGIVSSQSPHDDYSALTDSVTVPAPAAAPLPADTMTAAPAYQADDYKKK